MNHLSLRRRADASRGLLLSILVLLTLLFCAVPGARASGGTLIGKTLTRIPGGDNYAIRAIVQPSDGKILIAGAARFGTLQYQITRYNTDGSLDAAFANNGTILEPLGPGNGEAWAIALQSDGKIVVAGHVRSDKDRFGIARFNADGTLDLSFGGGGSAKSAGPGDSGGFAMAMQSDGKIVVGGYSMTAASGGHKVFTVARYNADDTLDTTFGTGGFAIAPAGAADEVIRAIGIQANGEIVAAGPISTGGTRFVRFTASGALDGTWATPSVSYTNGANDMVVQSDGRIAVVVGVNGGSVSEVGVLRMNADGTVDTTFGNGACAFGACPGVAHMPISNSVTGYGLALQSGNYVVSGDTANGTGSTAVALGRFTSTGAIDTTFGTSGTVVSRPTGSGDAGRGLALRADGRIIVAGLANGSFGDYDSVAAAFTANGAVDTTFNTSGYSKIDVGSMTGEWRAAALQSDGNIVAVGFTVAESHTSSPGTKAGVIARYLANGTLDTTFGTGGITQFAWPANAVALQSDGKIVVGGSSLTGSPAKTAMTFGRFNTNGTADTGFGASGTFVVAPASADEEINSVAIQSDGNIVGGGFVTGTYLDSVVVRVTPAGALDTTFNGSGKVVASMSTGSDQINAIAIQGDGKIVGAGWADVSSSQDSMALTRVNTNGSVDATFGAAGVVDVNFGTTSSYGYALSIQSDGNIVVAGKMFDTGNSTDDFAIARLTASGALDTTFGTNGMTSSDFGNHNRIFALAHLANGKFLGAGETGGLFALVQYLANGTLDTSFGTNGAIDQQINAGNDFANAIVVGSDGTAYVAGNGSGVLALARFTTDLSTTTADLGITQSASPNPATAGQNVTFTLTVTNAGPATATSVVVTDTLPSGVTFVSASAGCSNSSGTVSCNIASIASGASVQVSIVAQTTAAGTIANSATVSSAQVDPNSANNNTSASITVNAPPPAVADVGISQVASPSSIIQGQNATFTLTVSNAGPSAASGITVADTLPAGVTFVSASSGCNNASGAVTCGIASLASGASVQLSIVVTAPTAGTITNNARVSAAQSDNNNANNTSSASVAVAAGNPLLGLSTRMQVLTGDNVLIGGFIIGGSTPKTVIVRARGPSLGVAGALADPTLTLVPANGDPSITNDDWGTAANAAQVSASGFAPSNAKESAILVTLNPGAYTAIVSGVGNTTGVAIVEVYEVDHPEVPLTAISTRGKVQTGDNVMIGGFIIEGSQPRTVVVRARGPSLAVAGALADPTLTLVPANGDPTITNDDWGSAPNAAQISASGYAPSNAKESAILVTLNPGAYTAVVSGVGGATGVGIVEVFAVQ